MKTMWAVLIWANTTEADVHREKLECDDWIHHRCYKSIRKRVLMPPTTVLLLQSLTYLLGVCVHRSKRKRELLWHSLCSASTTTGCFPSSCSWKHVKSKMSQFGRMENIRKHTKQKKHSFCSVEGLEVWLYAVFTVRQHAFIIKVNNKRTKSKLTDGTSELTIKAVNLISSSELLCLF